MTLYGMTLFAHSNLRWLVLGLAVWVVVRSVLGWKGGEGMAKWGRGENAAHGALVGAVHLSVVLGILLYAGVGPWGKTFWADPAAGMKEPVVRFFGMEHVLMMLIGATLIQVGRIVSRKAETLRQRHKRVLIWTLAGLVIIGVAIPWPGTKKARPLGRGVAVVMPLSGGGVAQS